MTFFIVLSQMHPDKHNPHLPWFIFFLLSNEKLSRSGPRAAIGFSDSLDFFLHE